jgi:hypothetical protein
VSVCSQLYVKLFGCVSVSASLLKITLLCNVGEEFKMMVR